MPLTAVDEPGIVDAFGVRFTMEALGKRVRCHVFRTAIAYLDDSSVANDDDLLARFQKNRAMFERLAANLYDAGHQTPWIEAVIVAH